MKRWLCQDSPSLQQIMLQNFTELNICDNSNCAPLGRMASNQQELVKNSPNPVLSNTKVQFITNGGHTLLQLVSPEGLVIATLLEATYDRPQTIFKDINLSSYKPGLYYLRFQNGSNQQMKPIIKAQ